jgi:hypothetical protein
MAERRATARACGNGALTSIAGDCQSRANLAQACSGAGSLNTRCRMGSVRRVNDGMLLLRCCMHATTMRKGAIWCRSRQATQASRICATDATPMSSQAPSVASDITSRLTASTS